MASSDLSELAASLGKDVENLKSRIKAEKEQADNWRAVAEMLFTSMTREQQLLIHDLVQQSRDVEVVAAIKGPGYGVCPACGCRSPKTTRERRPNGYTKCGTCDHRVKNVDWDRHQDR